jgi:hypothetical protein
MNVLIWISFLFSCFSITGTTELRETEGSIASSSSSSSSSFAAVSPESAYQTSYDCVPACGDNQACCGGVCISFSSTEDDDSTAGSSHEQASDDFGNHNDQCCDAEGFGEPGVVACKRGTCCSWCDSGCVEGYDCALAVPCCKKCNTPIHSVAMLIVEIVVVVICCGPCVYAFVLFPYLWYSGRLPFCPNYQPKSISAVVHHADVYPQNDVVPSAPLYYPQHRQDIYPLRGTIPTGYAAFPLSDPLSPVPSVGVAWAVEMGQYAPSVEVVATRLE